MEGGATSAPEQGQLVRVRNQHWLVQDVDRGIHDSGHPQHRVRLEGLEEVNLGRELDVIWEHELHTQTHDALGLPTPEDWDPVERFDAFIDATRWSLTSVLEGLPLQAPFRGNIQIEDYQLEPVVRALRMPRVSLLIADDVGLGKTIEAGLVMQELIARQRVRRVLILCPSSLKKQWQEEMRDRFALRFEIVDLEYVDRLRKEYGAHINPWTSFPRLITSMDFLKRHNHKNAFFASLRSGRGAALKDWDLLILDEAHNVTPAGRGTWVRDSDRTVMVREIKDAFEHRLFLTATPHNGYTESFTALLEMLDPIRFSRGPHFDRDELRRIMVRRLKDGIHDALGRRVFPKRDVKAIPVRVDGDERELMDLLDAYIDSRLARAGNDTLAVRFALVMLKRRLLSSVAAFAHSIKVHQGNLVGAEAPDREAERVVTQLRARFDEEHDDDVEKDEIEQTALLETARFFDVTDEERRMVERMVQLSDHLAERADRKAAELIAWIGRHLEPQAGWNEQRLVVFTEFRDTLVYLRRLLAERGWSDRVLELFGGMPTSKRETVKSAFNAPPTDDGPAGVRILLATDAAAEGLNLQRHCSLLVHHDIPWNPNRMEQRNGRIDRHGQPAEEVLCRHFLFEGREDADFLKVVVDKVDTQRADLGAVGDVIASQVEEAMLRRRRKLELPRRNVDRMRAEVRAEVVQKERVRELQRRWKDARRELGLTPDRLQRVVEQALALEDRGRLEPATLPDLKGAAFWARDLPTAWREARAALQGHDGLRLALAFDEATCRDRKDTTLVHLDHPLMKRALAVFRANLWSQGLHETHRLRRVAYRVVDGDLDRPVVAALARLVATSAEGGRLHEELFAVGGELDGAELLALPDSALQAVLRSPGASPAIPREVGSLLRRPWPKHRAWLTDAIEQRRGVRAEELHKELRAKANEDARYVRKLIDQRRREIRKTLDAMENEAQPAQLALWPQEQRDQHQVTRSYLQRRLTQLEDERSTQPDAVKKRYELRAVRAFPVGVLFLLPKSLVGGDS